MKAEIIAIGTEILLGQIVNTNAQYMAKELADLGVDVYFQGVVGDNMTRVKEALTIASSRSDLVICCGGLGPTEDDLTKDAIAEFTDAKLVIDEGAEKKILELFKDGSESLIASNKRQAHTIEGSHLLKNEVGLAVGFVRNHQGTYYAVLPGPPREMKVMFEQELKPLIDNILGERKKLYSKYLKFGNIGESAVEDTLKQLITEQNNVSIAPYAGIGEITIRLTVKAHSPEQAEAEFLEPAKQIRGLLNDYLYSEENESLEQALSKIKIDDFGVYEINTNAYLSHRILTTDMYHENLKVSTTKVEKATITEALARQQFTDFIEQNKLKNAIGVFHCQISQVSITPSGRPRKTFFIALCVDKKIKLIERTFIGDMQAVQIRAAKTALFLLLKALKR
ncbi:CinA family nicotinamide mononucleotide deamidase-related protein [Psychrobacter phenylpyruvicus]|uniref:CinA-like protein n=1 Tax=Psychrobacter phenylpyruvicus TaxID=29432 RepID=A0A379LID8_9GAMM|nr:CinA family nicotinamide mononucleotide deamidase-related protein [Psychrobacter phenylpyruvicus]SUD90369.1 CinA-like protein [Psychrobacter phenylpyruvicus]